MKMHLFRRLAAVPLVLAGALSLPALVAQEKPSAEAKPPTAREVVARFVEAIGGREAVLKHSSTRLKGKWEMPTMGQSGEFELLRAKPNRQVMIIRVGEQMEVRQGFDGTVAWITNPFGGPMVLNGKMLDQAREDADFYNTLREEQNYKSMETVGLGRFEGKEAVELKLVHKSGREVREYFDPKTGLLIGSKGTQESPQGANEVTLVFADYKKLGSILEPTRITVKATGFEQSITTTGVEYDKLTDKDFALPEEIRALLKK